MDVASLAASRVNNFYNTIIMRVLLLNRRCCCTNRAHNTGQFLWINHDLYAAVVRTILWRPSKDIIVYNAVCDDNK